MTKTTKAADEDLLLDAALEAIPYGFCVWSADFHLLMWNRHYCDIYGFRPDLLHRGMTLQEIVRMSADLGNHPSQSPEQFLGLYSKELMNNRGGARAKSQEVLAGGRIVASGGPELAHELERSGYDRYAA